ncbi:hypothetical protein BRC94_13470 [Halobacteriales archaeon QS_5_70_17]|jgi:hypothetical protein|nr:MAG: hypothetical protein BRC94_13470 [Halobacteriales archaeon QS_5_70_17]
MSGRGGERADGASPETDPDARPAFEELPTSDIEVEYHVHFGMTGSFPLRLAELFLANDGLHVAEYAYITPMFGLGMKKHRREADAMARIFDAHGVDEVLLQADTVHWYPYDSVRRIVVHDGGRIGRPRIAVHASTGERHAYRLHAVDDLEELVEGLRATVAGRDVAVERESGVGFSPRESLERFFVHS